MMASRLPEWWYELDGIDFRLLEELLFLSDGEGFCFPSRAYLAAQLRVNIGTISRHVTKLNRLGVLQVKQRRAKHPDGTWSTHSNYYWIVPAPVRDFDKLVLQMTPAEITRLKALSYTKFLQSRYWAIISGYIKYQARTCARCGGEDTLDVHHMTYQHLGE